MTNEYPDDRIGLVVARYQDDNMPRALRIDRASRWVFPIAYLGLLALVVTTAGA